MALELFNTLSRKKEVFVPKNTDEVSLYTCGPTVYNFAHIGNLRYFIFTDILKRTLVLNGYAVNHVMNITDVGHLTSDADEGEDKLEKGAKRERKTVWEVATFYTDQFLKDIKALSIQEATHLVPATSLIDKQIAMITLLERKNFTYVTDLAVYFDTTKLEDYGKLTGQKIEDKQTERDVVRDPGKKRQADFALWFFRAGHYKDHQMHWDSPWGDGFPGWHLECSAINWQFFPMGTDIHTGGIDHIPVHHTNEIAQYEAALDQPMAPYWLHQNFLVVGDNAKMAKSGDNFLTLTSITDRKIDPLAYRYFTLQATYRNELQFSWEALLAAQAALKSLRYTVSGWEKAQHEDTGVMDNFLIALNDDLNTPKALAIMWDLVKSDINTAIKSATILKIDEVLGLGLAEHVSTLRTQTISAKAAVIKKTLSYVVESVPEDVKKLVVDREVARDNKDYPLADTLRDAILAKGFTIEDLPEGPRVDQYLKIDTQEDLLP